MTTINLKDFFYWYIADELIEVTEEVAKELQKDKRCEYTHWRRGCGCPCVREKGYHF